MAEPVKWSTEQLVNTIAAGDQGLAKVVALEGGGFAAVWQDNSGIGGDANYAIKAQIFDASGARIGGEILVNTTTNDWQMAPSVAALANGTFVVVWDGGAPGDPNNGIAGQLFGAAGQKLNGEFLVNTVTDVLNDPFQAYAVVTALDTGGFAVAYESHLNGGDTSVRVQRFDDNAAKLGPEIIANTIDVGEQYSAGIANTGTGAFAVVWQDDSQSPDDNSSAAVRMQIFNDDGTPRNGEKLVNHFTTGSQQFPSVVGQNGQLFVTFRDMSGGLTSNIYDAGAIFDDEGDLSYSELVISTPVNVPQPASVTKLPDGTFFAVWIDFAAGTTQISGQLVSSTGAKVGSLIKISTSVATLELKAPTAIALPDGRLAVVWDDDSHTGGDALGRAVRMQIVDPRGGIVNGTDKGETIYGSFTGSIVVNDDIHGKGGADIIHGLDGDDTIDGGAGDDAMWGGTGNDTYVIDTAGDTVHEEAGEGIDEVKSPFALVLGANLDNGSLLGVNSVNITGNGLANRLTGNQGNNVLDGGDGLDVLKGGLGNDVYILGNGADTVEDSGGIDTATSTISRSLAAMVDVDNLVLLGNAPINGTGNALKNTITGNNGANTLDGAGGADLMRGLKGNDRYFVNHAGDVVDEGAAGSNGIDTVYSTVSVNLASAVQFKGLVERVVLTGTSAINVSGNAFANYLEGNAAKNTINGGIGNDTLSGQNGNDMLVGGAGNDILTGGLGRDIASGGAGNDRFKFNGTGESPANAGRDVINDFDDSGNDTIDLSSAFGGTLGYRGMGSFSGAGQVRIVDIAGPHLMIEVNTGGSLAADMQILLANTTSASMTQSDFIL